MPLHVRTGLVKLRDAPGRDAPNQAGVLVSSDLLERIGDADAQGWVRVRVVTPGAVRREGFVQDDLLEEAAPPPVSEAVDKERFFDQLALSARVFGTNSHFLYALAFVESGVRNVPGRNSDTFGPFQFMPATWAELVARHGGATGVSEGDLTDPGRQAILAAAWIADLQKRLTAETGRVPSGAELYLGHFLGPAAAIHVLRSDAAEGIDRPLRRFYKGTAKGEGFAELVLAANASLLRPASGPRSVAEVLDEVGRRFAPGLSEAAELAARLGLVPEKMPGDPGEEPPWMAVARAELRAGVAEDKAAGASNPRIEAYFATTGMGAASDDNAWCAAFVSFCMASCGNDRVATLNRHSARAADWLGWGFPTGRPVTGAVAVTHPLVAGTSGHVGFVTGGAGGKVRLLAGNQRDDRGREAVCERDYPAGEMRDFRWIDWKAPGAGGA